MSFVAERDKGQAAARAARVRLGMGLEAPLSDVTLAVEDLAGVPVTVIELPAGLVGLQGRKHDRSFIFLSGVEAPVRQRFSLAHEFGHVELRHAGSVDYVADVFGDDGGRRAKPPVEVQADGFAAEFLAPLTGVRRWLEAVGEPPDDLETVVRLGDYFHVSAEAALYRLQAARRLTRGKIEALKAQIADGRHAILARRLGLGESDDTLSRAHGRLPRFPRATVTHAARAYERGLLTVGQVARLLEVGPDVIEAEFARRGVRAGSHEQDF